MHAVHRDSFQFPRRPPPAPSLDPSPRGERTWASIHALGPPVAFHLLNSACPPTLPAPITSILSGLNPPLDFRCFNPFSIQVGRFVGEARPLRCDQRRGGPGVNAPPGLRGCGEAGSRESSLGRFGEGGTGHLQHHLCQHPTAAMLCPGRLSSPCLALSPGKYMRGEQCTLGEERRKRTEWRKRGRQS